MNNETQESVKNSNIITSHEVNNNSTVIKNSELQLPI